MHSGDEQADIPEEFVFSVTLRITGENPADVLQIEFRGDNKPYWGAMSKRKARLLRHGM